MTKFHTLKFDDGSMALAMAKRMVDLCFQVYWNPKKPGEVLYKQALRMPKPNVLMTQIYPVEKWIDHGLIDTRK